MLFEYMHTVATVTTSAPLYRQLQLIDLLDSGSRGRLQFFSLFRRNSEFFANKNDTVSVSNFVGDVGLGVSVPLGLHVNDLVCSSVSRLSIYHSAEVLVSPA